MPVKGAKPNIGVSLNTRATWKLKSKGKTNKPVGCNSTIRNTQVNDNNSQK
jgi:hypothetical protein